MKIAVIRGILKTKNILWTLKRADYCEYHIFCLVYGEQGAENIIHGKPLNVESQLNNNKEDCI